MDALSRQIKWPHCLNVRDLGGIETPLGPIPFHAFIRSDDLATLDDDGLHALRAYGVASILDLRRQAEVIASPPHPSLASLRYHHIPLLDDLPSTFLSLDAVYLFIARERSSRLAEISSILALAPTPIAFHCLHGKDRTGIVAALLLSLAGVPDEAILLDYTLSDTHLVPLYARLREAAPKDQLTRVLDDSSCPPRRLLSVLDFWRSQGGAAACMQHAGLSHASLDALLTRLHPA